MNDSERQALSVGYERVSAWANVLDRINVFPVADGDTGRNLVVSLAPLRCTDLDQQALVNKLLISARGNSGNIGVRFLEGFLTFAEDDSLLGRVNNGRELARNAVADPKPGTMLSLFDALASALQRCEPRDEQPWVPAVLSHLEKAVRDTPNQLPVLEEAGVVDAGALGMFLFFDGYLHALVGRSDEGGNLTEQFPTMVAYTPKLEPAPESGFCVDAVLHAADLNQDALERLLEEGQAAVTFRQGEYVKVHLHTDDRERVRAKLEQLGSIVRWAWDDIDAQTRSFARPAVEQAIHIMTDAAGSITRDTAERLGVTVLDSYISIADLSLPESHVRPADLYRSMTQGAKVSTSQASDHERHQHYEKILSLHPRVLYLCVGSIFTGNHEVVTRWKEQHDPDDRLIVIDTGAASGKLGIVAVATARRSIEETDPESVLEFAHRAVGAAEEYVFLDKLQYLAAGGRLSKTSAFFGDLLHMKPVVSPTSEGAKKVAVVRNTKDQVSFAMARLGDAMDGGRSGLVMLEYSDNEAFVQETVLPKIESRFPEVEVILQPLSLTSGAHMGPGTWALAVLPDCE